MTAWNEIPTFHYSLSALKFLRDDLTKTFNRFLISMRCFKSLHQSRIAIFFKGRDDNYLILQSRKMQSRQDRQCIFHHLRMKWVICIFIGTANKFEIHIYKWYH